MIIQAANGALNAPMPCWMGMGAERNSPGLAEWRNGLLTRHNVGLYKLRRMAALPGRAGDDRIAGEQAALRRVATLVARAAPPAEVFAAVTEEAGRLLGADYMTMARYEPDGGRTIVAAWSRSGAAFPVGDRKSLGGRNVSTLVFRTSRPARIDDYSGASGPVADAVRGFGFRASVGVPVSVEGRLWGVMLVGSRAGPLPAGTEARLAGFTELAATAIANAQARVELRRFAEEQAALRRVATLVARAAAPEEVFAAVTEEAGRLLGADYAAMGRYDPDGTRALVATWSSTGAAFPVGPQVKLGGRNLPTLVALLHARQVQRVRRGEGRLGPGGIPLSRRTQKRLGRRTGRRHNPRACALPHNARRTRPGRQLGRVPAWVPVDSIPGREAKLAHC
jgi:GAF domain-containing protein